MQGLELSGKCDELVKCVSDCVKSGNHHTLDPTIDNGKSFAAKVLKESLELPANCSLVLLPFTLSTGWRAFPSHNIPGYTFQLRTRAILRVRIHSKC